jgi:hypothetical protein
MQYDTSICLEGPRKAKRLSVRMVDVPAQIENGHFQNTRKMCHYFASVHILCFFLIKYLMCEDGQYGCNMWDVLKGLIKFVMVDGNMYVSLFLSVVCICPVCTNYTNTVQWTLVWAPIMPVAMKHWPHKLVVCLFSPSSSLEIKGGGEWYINI